MIRILFTGDCRFDRFYRNGINNIFSLFPNYDLYVFNFESAIQIDPSLPYANKSTRIISSIEEVEYLLSFVDSKKLLLNFANNHSLDASKANLDKAKTWLFSKGVQYVDSKESVSLSIGTSVFAFHAFGNSDWLHSPNFIIKNDSAHNIFLLHWGEEYVPAPSPKQREIARLLAYNGANLIIGCHSHILQASEVINNCNIHYSLGNTLFGFPGMPSEGLLGSIVSLNANSNSLLPETIPCIMSTTGNFFLLTNNNQVQTYSELQIFLKHLLNLNQANWYMLASTPFFANHMQSWKRRFILYGGNTILKFLRACLSKTYLNMFIGRMKSLILQKKNSCYAHYASEILYKSDEVVKSKSSTK